LQWTSKHFLKLDVIVASDTENIFHSEVNTHIAMDTQQKELLKREQRNKGR